MSVSNTFRAGNDLVTEQRNAISYNPNDIDPSNWRLQFNDMINQIRSTL